MDMAVPFSKVHMLEGHIIIKSDGVVLHEGPVVGDNPGDLIRDVLNWLSYMQSKHHPLPKRGQKPVLVKNLYVCITTPVMPEPICMLPTSGTTEVVYNLARLSISQQVAPLLQFSIHVQKDSMDHRLFERARTISEAIVRFMRRN